MASTRYFLLTGPPGIGKTTAVKKISSLLVDLKIPICGFYTEEVRKNGQRIGFDVVTLDGTRGCLARVSELQGVPIASPKVGKYTVYIKEFENLIASLFEKTKEISDGVIIIDEIGKMEMFSNLFITNIKHLFDNSNNVILATVPLAKGKPLHLVEYVTSSKKSALFTVNIKNRNEVPSSIIEQIKDHIVRERL